MPLWSIVCCDVGVGVGVGVDPSTESGVGVGSAPADDWEGCEPDAGAPSAGANSTGNDTTTSAVTPAATSRRDEPVSRLMQPQERLPPDPGLCTGCVDDSPSRGPCLSIGCCPIIKPLTNPSKRTVAPTAGQTVRPSSEMAAHCARTRRHHNRGRTYHKVSSTKITFLTYDDCPAEWQTRLCVPEVIFLNTDWTVIDWTGNGSSLKFIRENPHTGSVCLPASTRVPVIAFTPMDTFTSRGVLVYI